jgi:hypothetical protein
MTILPWGFPTPLPCSNQKEFGPNSDHLLLWRKGGQEKTSPNIRQEERGKRVSQHDGLAEGEIGWTPNERAS